MQYNRRSVSLTRVRRGAQCVCVWCGGVKEENKNTANRFSGPAARRGGIIVSKRARALCCVLVRRRRRRDCRRNCPDNDDVSRRREALCTPPRRDGGGRPRAESSVGRGPVYLRMCVCVYTSTTRHITPARVPRLRDRRLSSIDPRGARVLRTTTTTTTLARGGADKKWLRLAVRSVPSRPSAGEGGTFPLSFFELARVPPPTRDRVRVRRVNS